MFPNGIEDALLRPLRMSTLRRFFILPLTISIVTTLPVAAANGVNPDDGKADGVSQAQSSELAEGWRLVRTHNPNGGADTISIMRPADTSRSDLDLVGIMIRCNETTTEVVIVVLPVLPFRIQPQVAFGKPENESQFEAKIARPGTLVLVPQDATILVNGPWQNLDDLFIRVSAGQSIIRGVVKLAGLQAAFKKLQATCAAH
jgi:hypothetical protein